VGEAAERFEEEKGETRAWVGCGGAGGGRVLGQLVAARRKGVKRMGRVLPSRCKIFAFWSFFF
jgi:hypothetical protein